MPAALLMLLLGSLGHSPATAGAPSGSPPPADNRPEGAGVRAPIVLQTPNRSPEFPSTETGHRTVEENTAAGTPIGDPLAATDPDGDTLTYSLATFFTRPDHEAFSIDASTGQLSTKNALDFETKSTYLFNVRATDTAGNFDVEAFTVRVIDVDEAPVITGDAAKTYPENDTAVVATYRATDEKGRITWGLSGDDASEFTINSAGQLSFKVAPDVDEPADSDMNNVYQVTVEATDVSENTSRFPVSVTIFPVIEGDTAVRRPEGSDRTVATYTVTDPNPAILYWRLTGDDAGDFLISWGGTGNRDGTLTFASTTDFSNPADADTDNVYEVTLVAWDGTVDRLLDVTVTITELPNPPPSISSGAGFDIRLAENFPFNRTFTLRGGAGETITASLGGPDAADFILLDEGFGGSWSITSRKTPDFENPDDSNGDNIYRFTLKAHDGSSTSTQAIKVTVTDQAEAPRLAGPYALNFLEGGTGVVATYTASDDDAGDTATLSLSGTDADDFTITSGQLTFRQTPTTGSPQDADSNNIYELTVEASDGSNKSTLNVRVKVTESANQSPTITSGPITQNHRENTVASSPVGTYVATDPESDGITWSVSGTDSAHFNITSDGKLRFMVAPDHDRPLDDGGDNNYQVTVAASDGTGRGTRDVTVTVTDVNEAPSATGAQSVEVSEGSTTVGTYAATDPDGDVITWSVTGTDDGDFNISNAGALSFKEAPNRASPADHDGDNVYSVTVKASDGVGFDTVPVVVTVTAVNAAPEITGGDTAKNYPENGTGAVDTYTATDPDGDVIIWSVSGTDADAFTINSAGALSFKVSPDFENKADSGANNVYDVTVNASDGTLSHTRDVTVTVTGVNEPPVVKGPRAVTKKKGSSTDVATYMATDPEGEAIFAWSLTAQPLTETVPFQISNQGVLTFKAAPNPNRSDADNNNVFELNVEARDTTGNWGSLAVQVIVTLVEEATNAPPVISGDREVPRQEGNDTSVATYMATDPEDDTITWSLEGTDANDFNMNAGVLTFKHAPNYESPTDDDEGNDYEVTVVASDATNRATREVTVTITDVNEPPVIGGPTDPEYAENGTDVVGVYTATDPERTTIGWTLSSTDADDFDIDTSGVLTFKTSPDFENPADQNPQDNVYKLTVTASDGALTDTLDVTVTVSNVNEAPTITSGPVSENYQENGTAAVGKYTATDPENDTITWTLSGAGEDDLEIDSASGVLTFSTPPDFEDPAGNVYQVTVTASDGTLTDTRSVEVTVTNVNEAPTVSGSSMVTKPEGDDRFVATYRADDPEDDTITWTLSSTDEEDFTINARGELSFRQDPDVDNPRDADGNNVYLVRITGSDGALSDTLDVTITVADVNEAPTVTDGPTDPTYAENGTAAVGAYTATDPENDTIHWSLIGPDREHLTITPRGVLSFLTSPDFENPAEGVNHNLYRVTVVASDGTNQGTRSVVVRVTDVNEAPTITGGPTTKIYEESDTAAVGTYEATDPEDDTITWTLSGADEDDLEIDSASGVLTFSTPPNLGNPTDSDRNNVYEVTVTASDGFFEDTRLVEVTVVREGATNQAPTITGRNARDYPENLAVTVETYTVTDPEDDDITWSLSGPDRHDFEINADGELRFSTPPDYESRQDSNRDNKYQVTVEASDRWNETTLDITITVTDVNEAPTITNGPTATYAENGTAAVDTYTATDPEGAAIRWWLSGDDAIAFEIDAAGGRLTFANPPDHEASRDLNGNNAYQITVHASDGTNETTLEVTVTVTDVNEPPMITGTLTTVQRSEDETGVLSTFTATDPENFAVRWSLSGRDAGDFTINAAGELRFAAPPDYESPQDSNRDNFYEVTIQAFDGVRTGTLDVTVTIEDITEEAEVTLSHLQPQVGVPLRAALEGPEYRGSSITWTWEVGASTTQGVPPRQVSAQTPGASDGTAAVILSRWGPPGGVLLERTSNTRVWQGGASAGAGPGASGHVLQSVNSPTYTPTEADIDQPLSVSASYTDVHGQPKTVKFDAPHQPRAAPEENSPPAFPDDEDGVRSIGENQPAGPIGDPVEAEDPDGTRDLIVYSLSGSHAPSFEINQETGQLSTRGPLDREARSSYRVRVTATDPSGASDMIDVTINVEDENEPPVVTGDTTVFHRSGNSGAVFTYRAVDPERTTVTWAFKSFSGAVPEAAEDNGYFSISPGGVLRFDTTPDHESPHGWTPDNIYRVTLEATDADGQSTDLEVTVAVLPTTAPRSTPTTSTGGGFSGGGGGGGVPTGGGGGGGGGFHGGDGDETPATASGLFTDVPAGAWFESAVNWMILHKVTSGCAVDKFCPEDNLTRQQFVTFLWRAAGRPTPKFLGSAAFADVAEGVYSDQSIGWAVAGEITLGCTPGEFGDGAWEFCPTQQVTRGQMATLLHRHTEAEYPGSTSRYEDVQPDDYYATGVAWLTDFQVVSGCSSTLFCPDRPATRAEAAVFINGVAIRPHIWGEGNTSFIPQAQ